MINLKEYRITFEVYKSGNEHPETHEIPMIARTLEDAVSMFVKYIKIPEHKTIEIIMIERYYYD